MKTNILLAGLSLLSITAFSQTQEIAQPAGLISMTKLEAGLHGIGIGYEIPLGQTFTIDLSAGLGGGYSIEDEAYANGFRSTFILREPAAYFRSRVKYTYNRAKRAIKNKSMLNNTGNYVSFQTKYATNRVFETNEWNAIATPINRTLLNELQWGMQRPLGQRFTFNAHLGMGYAYDFDFRNSQAYPAAGLQLAYIISKSRRF